MLDRILKFLTSLKLVVACLALSVVLVFVGTVAQVKEGLYESQTRYFKSFFVWWSPGDGSWGIPVMPGGYLLGGLLLVSLIMVYAKRFQFTKKKTGILISHLGVILLLIGQLATDMLARESHMRLQEGGTKTFSESFSDYELVFLTDAGPDEDEVVSIPVSLVVKQPEIAHPKLPFVVRIKTYMANSDVMFRPPQAKNDPPQASQGAAQRFTFRDQPVTRKMNDKNVPTVLIELQPANGSSAALGTWMVSGWAGDEVMLEALEFSWRKQYGEGMEQMVHRMAEQLGEPQKVEAGGKTYAMVLRPTRYYKPFAVTLLETKHEVYRGTTRPKNYQSRVRIENPATRENREVDIYMNNPLRYEGLTFYQFQMSPLESSVKTSTFQVVRNPGWLTPYAGCAMVGGGLLVQFLIHLVGFMRKRKTV